MSSIWWIFLLSPTLIISVQRNSKKSNAEWRFSDYSYPNYTQKDSSTYNEDMDTHTHRRVRDQNHVEKEGDDYTHYKVTAHAHSEVKQRVPVW